MTTMTPGAPFRLADGVELLGAPEAGSTEPQHLLRRADGQVIGVSALLAEILRRIGEGDEVGGIAAALSTSERQLPADTLSELILERLVPLGIVERAGAEPAKRLPRAAPLLALTLRGTLIPASIVQRLAPLLTWLFARPVVIVALIAWIAVDAVLLVTADLESAFVDTVLRPESILALSACFLLAAVLHELGHATACSAAGARPGRIGVGVYIVFLAFFTDVTDSYRLGRRGRLQTDLGGLYGTVLTVLLAAAAWWASGEGFVLVLIAWLHLGMLQQLFPLLRLDGYFVLADLTGVPDLFGQVRPVLRSLLPGRELDPRLARLRPGVRRVVIAWVLLVVPLVAASLAWLLWNMPMIVQQTLASASAQALNLAARADVGDVVGAAVSAIGIAIVVLPVIGIAIVLGRAIVQVLRALVVAARARRAGA